VENYFAAWDEEQQVWQGQYKVVKEIFGNSHMFEMLQGDRLLKAIKEIFPISVLPK
jgi:hypothetical protein